MADDASCAWHLLDSQLLSLPLSTDLPAIVALETRSPATAAAFRADLGLAAAACRRALGSQQATSQDNTWAISWLDFCAEHNVDSLLKNCPDPIPYFQVFAQRYRDGRLAKDGHPVQSCTVEDAFVPLARRWPAWGPWINASLAPAKLNTA